MTLASQMRDDASTLLPNTDEHAIAISVMDDGGVITNDVAVIIEHATTDVEKVTNGRDIMRRAMVGIPSTYEVNDDWQFLIAEKWWAVSRDQAAPITDDGAGWLWVNVVSAEFSDRGEPGFNAR